MTIRAGYTPGNESEEERTIYTIDGEDVTGDDDKVKESADDSDDDEGKEDKEYIVEPVE